MEFTRAVSALTIALTILILPIYGQISMPCSPSMITSFTPCLNFVTNSTGNGVSPTQGCCSSLSSLMSNGTGCLCLIATGMVPFQLPINRSLAISLPRACNMPGVPLQCKAASAPVPAPGPAALGPSTSLPAPSPSTSPQASTLPLPGTPTESPDSDTTPDLTPPSTTTGGGVTPTSNSGSRPVLTPSAASPAYSFSPFLLLAVVGAALLKYY